MKTEIFQCQCRTRFDLIICYNIMFALMPMIFFEFRVSNTRGHYKFYQQFSNCTSRSKFFSETVVTLWNSLPWDRVNFSSLHKFQSSLKSIDLIKSLVHWSLSVPSLCDYVHGYFYVFNDLMGFRKCSYSAWLSCSLMFLLCFYCLCSRMLNK